MSGGRCIWKIAWGRVLEDRESRTHKSEFDMSKHKFLMYYGRKCFRELRLTVISQEDSIYITVVKMKRLIR